MSNPQPDKGGRTEEALREYFLRAGYFAVRGVPFWYDGVDVTDVDIWLYIRPSPLGRERICVDAKDRGKPKALERILWTKGLQAILGLERCIVATTDKRPTVRNFGDEHGVLVFDGNMLGRLASSKISDSPDRISEEEFVSQIEAHPGVDRLLGQWRQRMLEAKSRLLTSLSFDGCNAWLEDLEYFSNETLTSSRRVISCRLVYLIISYLLIGVDYSMRSLAFEPAEERRRALQEGFRYGSGGREGAHRALKMATTLIDAYAPDAAGLSAHLRNQLVSDAGLLRVDALAEYFTRSEVSREMFSYARMFEAQAFARSLVPPQNLDPSLQGVIGVSLDFLGVDRNAFFKALESSGSTSNEVT